MATDILLIREGNRLAAYDAISAEVIDKIKTREIVTAEIRSPRNEKHHRKLFAVLENQSQFATTEELLGALKLATGLFDIGKTVDGIPYAIPKSISFAAMDQARFELWYEKAVEVILTRILPHTSRADFEAQIHEILGEDHGRKRQ